MTNAASWTSTKNATRISEQDIVQCLTVIQTLHPSFNPPDQELAIKLWHHSLKDYPIQEVKKAVYEVASRMKYTPKLADVIEQLQKQEPEPEGPLLETITPYNRYLQSLTPEELETFFMRSNALGNGHTVSDPNEFEIKRGNDYKDCMKLLNEKY